MSSVCPCSGSSPLTSEHIITSPVVLHTSSGSVTYESNHSGLNVSDRQRLISVEGVKPKSHPVLFWVTTVSALK